MELPENVETIEQWWEFYFETCLPKNMPPRVLNQARRVFYASAAGVLHIFDRNFRMDDWREEDERRFRELREEVSTFLADLRAGDV